MNTVEFDQFTDINRREFPASRNNEHRTVNNEHRTVKSSTIQRQTARIPNVTFNLMRLLLYLELGQV